MNKATAFFATLAVGLTTLSIYQAWLLHIQTIRVKQVAQVDSGPKPDSSTHQKWTNQPAPSALAPRVKAQSSVDSALEVPGTSTAKVGAQMLRTKPQSNTSADLAYRRLSLKIEHPDLADALRLLPGDAERFFDLLARQQAREAEWEQSDEATGDSSQRERERRRQADAAEQATFLGDDRVADWNNYTNSLGARAEARELRTLLIETDFPLRHEQYDRLVAMLATEQLRQNEEREQLRNQMRNPTFPSPSETAKYMDQRLTLIEDSLARRRRAALAVLDSEQMRQYEKMLELERLKAKVDYDATVAYAMATQPAR